MLEEWQIQPYQYAAVALCYRLNQDPYVASQTSPGLVPNWFVFAQRMAEHEAMVQVMRNYGFAV